MASMISSREDPLFPAHHSRSQHNFFGIELCGIMLVFKSLTRFLFTYGHHFSCSEYGKITSPAHGQLNRENELFPALVCP